ncbi:IS110 family transposase [Agrobacterium rosae]|uniref:IS110 family transposase n=1 Tax=Agrobacterium rosae TaxID=1972867 RepID=UPI003A7F9BEC
MITNHHVGCDISKNTIDTFDGSGAGHKRIDNSPNEIAKWLTQYVGSGACFIYEATGAYGMALSRTLAEFSLPGIVVNPMRARRFAQSRGVAAKTDKVDARMLADMASRFELEPSRPFDPIREALKALIFRRDQLTEQRGADAKRLLQCNDILASESLKRAISFFSAEIKIIQTQIDEQLASQKDLARDHALLKTVPGIGSTTATLLLALLPELGDCLPKAIASLSGCAPQARESGMHEPPRKISGGRPRVLKALYMAALAAIRTKTQLAEKYRYFRTNSTHSKRPKVALIAIARKIVVTANAVLRDKKAYI